MGFVWSGILGVLVDAINLVIAKLAVAITALLSILPNMPALPTPPSQLVAVEGWVAWALPVSTILAMLVFTASMYLLWYAVSIALRWAKVLRGNS
jgi:hypothetical protein